ncbi:protein of unknown function [Candidatus Nitrosocosmicus franklandus]|uniref:Uncharacterized protein n=1 Tax=Candidatus Nitrosocosmicus franklandianus TaxID=1798806 RepID=A0A484IKE4_9ARCH|nr:protein of unknown function [Candidatus Nitrosocosmicus franklandus]
MKFSFHIKPQLTVVNQSKVSIHLLWAVLVTLFVSNICLKIIDLLLTQKSLSNVANNIHKCGQNPLRILYIF